MTPQEVERRIAALERQVASRGVYGNPGLSTAFGAGSTSYRDHFPAELTSAYGASTGYSWERVVLDRATPTVANVTTPQAGAYAFTPDNDESLAAGARGYLIADPNAGGWIFLTGAAGPSAAPCGTACGSLVGLAADACLKLELVCATGSFAAIDTTQFAAVYAFGSAGVWTFKKWVPGSPGAWTAVTLDWLGGTGGAVFTWNGTPEPTFTLGGTTLTPRCDERDATFAAGPRNGVTGDSGYTPAAACESNELVLRVSCSCCPLDGWEGPGWYKVAAADCATDETSCVELLDGDECAADADFVICEGPFATEAECDPTPVATSCDATPVPSALTLALTAGAPGDPGAALVYDPGSAAWLGTGSLCGFSGAWHFACTGPTNWTLVFTRDSDSATKTWVAAAGSYTPFAWSTAGQFPFAEPGSCTGEITASVSA